MLDRIFPLRMAVFLLWIGSLPVCLIGLLLGVGLFFAEAAGSAQVDSDPWRGLLPLWLLVVYPWVFFVSGLTMYEKLEVARPCAAALAFHALLLVVGAIIMLGFAHSYISAGTDVVFSATEGVWFLVLVVAPTLALLAYLRILGARLAQPKGTDHALS